MRGHSAVLARARSERLAVTQWWPLLTCGVRVAVGVVVGASEGVLVGVILGVALAVGVLVKVGVGVTGGGAA